MLVDNDGNATYCGLDAYNNFNHDIGIIEPSFPEEFMRLYAKITELRNLIFDLEQTVRENIQAISDLEGEIAGLEKDVDRTYNAPTVLDVFIALGYTVVSVGLVIATVGSAIATGVMPYFGLVLGAVLKVDAEVWASTLDAWGTVGYQTDEYKAYKKALKEKKGERNALEYENYEITTTDVYTFTDWTERKGKISGVEDRLQELYLEAERNFPGMLASYEKYIKSNLSTTINPLN